MYVIYNCIRGWGRGGGGVKSPNFQLKHFCFWSLLKSVESRAEWCICLFWPLRWAALFALGLQAYRCVTVSYASLPFMVELNPRMWNVPLPNLEFLSEREKAPGRGPMEEARLFLLHLSSEINPGQARIRVIFWNCSFIPCITIKLDYICHSLLKL